MSILINNRPPTYRAVDWRRCFRIGDLTRLIGSYSYEGITIRTYRSVRLPLPTKRSPRGLRCLDAQWTRPRFPQYVTRSAQPISLHIWPISHAHTFTRCDPIPRWRRLHRLLWPLQFPNLKINQPLLSRDIANARRVHFTWA